MLITLYPDSIQTRHGHKSVAKTESKQIVVVEYIYYFFSFHSIHSFLAGIYYTVYNNQLVKVLFMFSENLQIKMIVHVQFALKYYPCISR